jgi:RNA polymerase sigma-70 factor (ECF subfamily)
MELSMPIYEAEDYLVQQAIKRDKIAFGVLYDRCIERLYRHVYYRVSNQSDAEDITQETFTRAWQVIDKYKNTGASFASWLIAIANNLIADHYRKRQKNIKIDEELVNNSEQVVNPEKQVETYFNNALVKEAVGKLQGDKQKVVLMHFIDGFSYEEIARALHKSEGAIRVIQYRALIELKGLLKRD